MLQKRGHTVVVAGNGRAALDQLAHESFDLVLMDVQMPEMDGLAATRTIRGQEQDTPRHIPIIAMTAYAMKGDKERCLEAGCDAYISKPIDSRTLFETVEGIVAMPKTNDAACQSTPLVVQVKPCDPIWDSSAALAKVDGDLPFLKEMIHLFASNEPKSIADLETAVGSGDSSSIMRAAHAIKGNVAVFCAKAAFDQALLLETKGKNNDIDGVSPDFQELKLRLLLLEHALSEFADNETR
jgi:CheY-like chemotaxis protein